MSLILLYIYVFGFIQQSWSNSSRKYVPFCHFDIWNVFCGPNILENITIRAIGSLNENNGSKGIIEKILFEDQPETFTIFFATLSIGSAILYDVFSSFYDKFFLSCRNQLNDTKYAGNNDAGRTDDTVLSSDMHSEESFEINWDH